MEVHKNLHNACAEYADEKDHRGESAAHHQCKRNGGQDEAKYEADEIRFETTPACAGVGDGWLIHLHHRQQIDDAENADPDDIEKMPEHAQTHQS